MTARFKLTVSIRGAGPSRPPRPAGTGRLHVPGWHGALWACLTLWLLTASVQAGPLLVFVSVAPQKTFVERIGGDHVRVAVMVPPGHNPATYSPTPRQIVDLGRAALYLRIGVPFEQTWMERIRAANPAMPVRDLREGLGLAQALAQTGSAPPDSTHAHPTHTHLGRDPHIWTSPLLVKQMAVTIRDALTQLLPARRDAIEANYRQFVTEMETLDHDIRQQLSKLRERRFMVFHPAWGYFAETYELTQVAIERQGKTPGASSLAATIDQARAHRVRVIIVQPQFDTRAATQVARAIGARVETCDPLSPDYVATLRRLTRLIAKGNQA